MNVPRKERLQLPTQAPQPLLGANQRVERVIVIDAAQALDVVQHAFEREAEPFGNTAAAVIFGLRANLQAVEIQRVKGIFT